MKAREETTPPHPSAPRAPAGIPESAILTSGLRRVARPAHRAQVARIAVRLVAVAVIDVFGPKTTGFAVRVRQDVGGAARPPRLGIRSPAVPAVPGGPRRLACPLLHRMARAAAILDKQRAAGSETRSHDDTTMGVLDHARCLVRVYPQTGSHDRKVAGVSPVFQRVVVIVIRCLHGEAFDTEAELGSHMAVDRAGPEPRRAREPTERGGCEACDGPLPARHGE